MGNSQNLPTAIFIRYLLLETEQHSNSLCTRDASHSSCGEQDCNYDGLSQRHLDKKESDISSMCKGRTMEE